LKPSSGEDVGRGGGDRKQWRSGFQGLTRNAKEHLVRNDGERNASLTAPSMLPHLAARMATRLSTSHGVIGRNPFAVPDCDIYTSGLGRPRCASSVHRAPVKGVAETNVRVPG
jgi:hypothetical protein